MIFEQGRSSRNLNEREILADLSPSHHEIVERLYPFESTDLQVLDTYIRSSYQPCIKPILMVVGASIVREATILREFHRSNYGIPPEDTKVVGCSIRAIPNFDNYDLTLSGEFRGNALDSATWMIPFMDLQSSNQFHYDLTYIRNPDLIDVHIWSDIYSRAISMTSTNGYVVSLIRESDQDRVERLLSHIRAKYQVTPEIHAVTGVAAYLDDAKMHHSIIAFRGLKT